MMGGALNLHESHQLAVSVRADTGPNARHRRTCHRGNGSGVLHKVTLRCAECRTERMVLAASDYGVGWASILLELRAEGWEIRLLWFDEWNWRGSEWGSRGYIGRCGACAKGDQGHGLQPGDC